MFLLPLLDSSNVRGDKCYKTKRIRNRPLPLVEMKITKIKFKDKNPILKGLTLDFTYYHLQIGGNEESADAYLLSDGKCK